MLNKIKNIESTATGNQTPVVESVTSTSAEQFESISNMQNVYSFFNEYGLPILLVGLGIGLAVAYILSPSTPEGGGTPPAPQDGAGPAPAGDNALEGIEEVTINPAISQTIADAFDEHIRTHVRTIHAWGESDANVYRDLDGANRGINTLIELADQCPPLWPIQLQLHKMLAQSNYPPENKLFDFMFTPAHESSKAAYILNMLTDPLLITYLERAISVHSDKGWEQVVENQSEFYYRLASFFEYTRIRALSGHVPPNLIKHQFQWAAIDLEVWVDNVVKYVNTQKYDTPQPGGLNEKLIQQQILTKCSPTSEQILLKYNSYKEAWNLPNLTLADIEPYVDSLAQNYSTCIDRYEQDVRQVKERLIRSVKLQNMEKEKIVTNPGSGSTSDLTTQEGASTSGSAGAGAGTSGSAGAGANTSGSAGAGAATSAGAGASTSGSAGAGASTSGSAGAGASTSSSGQPLVRSSLEPTSPIFDELSAGIAHLEFIVAEFAGPGFVLMLIVLALGLSKTKGQ